ncbi:MAG TPA: FHA domain-containing protein [Tepidisphaeraceae bacterium]|nr:FHA domain-containing protein [Tepidisphaeraceae bacterium]
MSLQTTEQTDWPILKPAGSAQDQRGIQLNRRTCVIGDRSRVHLPLRSPLVSRSHALVVIDASEVYVRDLASSNHLYINGSAVRETVLHGADLVQIGPFKFRCYRGFSRPGDEAQTSGTRAFLSKNGSARRYALEGRTFLIGRRKDCDLPLEIPAVSRVHAIIFRRDGRLYLRDLNSRAGTFVNGKPIREVELQDGDELQFAYVVLRYQSSPAAADSQAADSDIQNAAAPTAEGSATSQSGSGLLSGSKTEYEPVAYEASTNRTHAGANGGGADEPPAASADDLGFGGELELPRGDEYELGDGAELANAAELFGAEVNAPAPAPSAPRRVNRRSAEPSNGNGTH